MATFRRFLVSCRLIDLAKGEVHANMLFLFSEVLKDKQQVLLSTHLCSDLIECRKVQLVGAEATKLRPVSIEGSLLVSLHSTLRLLTIEEFIEEVQIFISQ